MIRPRFNHLLECTRKMWCSVPAASSCGVGSTASRWNPSGPTTRPRPALRWRPAVAPRRWSAPICWGFSEQSLMFCPSGELQRKVGSGLQRGNWPLKQCILTFSYSGRLEIIVWHFGKLLGGKKCCKTFNIEYKNRSKHSLLKASSKSGSLREVACMLSYVWLKHRTDMFCLNCLVFSLARLSLRIVFWFCSLAHPSC